MPKPVPWTTPTILAPMEGVTNAVMRAAIADLGGVGMLCTEFIRVSNIAVTPKQARREVVKYPGVPLSVQVMGRDKHLMADSAALIDSLDADVVDINLGCPTNRAVKGGVGAAMLKDINLLQDVLKAMRDSVKGLLSAKIRAGFEESDHVLDIARAVEDSGADFIAIHPRRRSDHYKGVADWRIIGIVKEHVSIPVIGNGDVWYADDALRLMDQTNCDAVMCGRGAMRNPWLFKQIESRLNKTAPYCPSGADMFSFMRKVQAGYQDFRLNDFATLSRMKELLRWVVRNWADNSNFRKSALRTQTLTEFNTLVGDTLSQMPAEALDCAPEGHMGLMASGAGE